MEKNHVKASRRNATRPVMAAGKPYPEYTGPWLTGVLNDRPLFVNKGKIKL